MVGADGATHQGSYDITYLGCLPGFVLMAASDGAELMHMVATAAAIDDRPSAFRYPRGDATGVELPERAFHWRSAKAASCAKAAASRCCPTARAWPRR